MAMAPCSLCHKPYRGPAHHAYPALVFRTGFRNNQHLRLDAACAEQLEDQAEPWLAYVGGEDAERGPAVWLCMGCEKMMEESQIVFFMTIYPKSDDRLDYFGNLHDGCRPPDWLEAALNVRSPGDAPKVLTSRQNRRRAV